MDARFMRNQTRTALAWRKINKRVDEQEQRKRKANGSDSSGSEREEGSSPRARNKKSKRRSNKQDTLPDWTKRDPAFFEISDSDEDILAPKKQKNSTIEDSPSKPNGRRARSRSRSLTPPPALTQFALQRARDTVNQVVGILPRPPSPTDFADESVDTIVLDDEMASIARRVQLDMKRQEGTPVREGGGPETVKLKIIWKPHPLNPNGRADIWAMVQKRHDNFHPLCAEIADLASIRIDNLVLSFDGKRVFPSSTPHSIGIWAEAELEACDKNTFQYLQENKRMRSESLAPSGPPETQDAARRSPSRARSPSSIEFLDEPSDDAAPAVEEHKEEKPADSFRLVVRSERTAGKNITLLVRPTTKCGAIVRGFLKKAGLEAEYPANPPAAKGRGRGKAAAPAKVPALSVDGDKMDPETEIGEADLEDGDQVDVVGL
ncbi:uncharacterized protein TRAVEDRAFT_166699 [Trametes versicolor FP-101664 SS1]|uniref:uncharacterized protein n=1 Tax=Trametes versicolor (strain FP-101664) TaxID=717944 RepID=UPI000462280E|nr:uncharacterized protein TRAVEDRAFT_166699 [Trametes versicolor FP-101664 SS1]EIW59359.1 hypothetical protein TRAVEDRAFT_166699 [Trametes versicolor FP-101664 SS1]